MTERTEITLQNAGFEPAADLVGLQRRALIVGVVGVAGLGAAWAMTGGDAHFWKAWLNGWLLVVAVAQGLFALSMLNHVAGGRWGALARRVFEASGRTLPLVFVLGLPIVLQPSILYKWARPEVVANDTLIQHKVAWLNTTGFTIRYVVYFLVWWLLAFVLSKWSLQHDQTGEEQYRVKMQKASAGGLVAYALTGTFASVDWIMSLDPHWFSSLFGFGFVVGHGLAAFAFLVPMMYFLGQRAPLDKLVTSRLFHDYGKLMLAFVMLWTYMTISQYLIIWSGNLPEEITWYLDRSGHGWKAISTALIVGHFGLPFFLLLSQDLKKKPRVLSVIAFWILAMRWFDYYWQVTPSVSHDAVAFAWFDPIAPLGLGGLWLAFLVQQLKGKPMVPVREPILKEVLAHG